MKDRYPSLIARMQSIFIDTVFIVIGMIAASMLLDMVPGARDWLRIVLFVAIFIAYEPLCLAFGCTIGNYLMRIRVKKHLDTSGRINFFQAIIRYSVKVLLGWLSFVTVHSNPSKRALHDMASGSVMIKLPSQRTYQINKQSLPI